ncbi:DUF6902 family protein [Seohaeicola zhoushanensis]|uniref:Uncharacterized protein n=1 Tax=Seohaeicola zhoushanensis TaxID=1569283 RepID=A0A8J3GXI3_9RHOB|nr:hypothetical protein [Seohaeicola zhoushanensis]GHF50062.1 hypothetical protein GCM10017056_22160 [Seohaeicola zhoushanensis]
MTNVIRLNVPSPRQGREGRIAHLVDCFASHRRGTDDVFWLKENAELLNILECTGVRPGAGVLEPHRDFYERIEKRLGFFPQYYRFLLSICLDLEDLGIGGGKGEALAAWVAREGLAEAEMSDLQRAEARRLTLRRGVDALPEDAGLTERLHRFAERSATFAMPNKKAAYELTHIVFYLSEYGRRDPGLSAAALESLEYAGLLAYLDQNADLLAEICVAQRFAGAVPPAIWEHWLEGETHRFGAECGPQAGLGDDYHDYLVCNWAMAVAGRDTFRQRTAPGRMAFYRGMAAPGPLRVMSECMLGLEDARSDDWGAMRRHVEARLSEAGHDILVLAEASSPRFGAFFAGFARTGLQGVAI